tara:strand:- start:288 stop:473 length:186 start_codon:yes stop_codon:yes gene_type:complete
MEVQTDPIVRIRINLSTSTKGVQTPDCTVEMTGTTVTRAMVLEEHTKLVQELKVMYPVVEA